MEFNVPKNFKRGRLIQNRFRKIDILILILGILLSVILLIVALSVFKIRQLFWIIPCVLPGLISGALISPFNMYHNILEYFRLLFMYINSPKRYIWEGIYKYDPEIIE